MRIIVSELGLINYGKRKGILIGKNLFAAVRISNENVLVQVLRLF